MSESRDDILFKMNREIGEIKTLTKKIHENQINHSGRIRVLENWKNYILGIVGTVSFAFAAIIAIFKGA